MQLATICTFKQLTQLEAAHTTRWSTHMSQCHTHQWLGFTCFKGVGAAGVAGLFTASGVPRPELFDETNYCWHGQILWFSIFPFCYLVGVASKLSTSILLGRGEFERDLFSPEVSDFLTLSNFLFSTTADGSASI